MENRGWNTKFLTGLSLTIIFLGLGLLWFSLKSESSMVPVPSPSVAPAVDVLPATESATLNIAGELVKVTKVVDGDTIVIESETTVRLIGVDTPETVDPRRPVQCFGKEASNKLKELLFDKEIILQKDVSETDKYGRLLRYVFLPLENGQTLPAGRQVLFINDYLVREGFAKVLTFPPDVKYNEQFRQAEREAKEVGRGLWGKCK